MTLAALRIGIVLLLVGAAWLYTVHGNAILLDLRAMSGIFCL